MDFNAISTSVVFLQIFLLTIAYKYDILFKDEEIFSRCEYPDVKSIDEYFDLSNTTFEFIDEDSIYVHGDTTSLKDTGRQDNPFVLEVFKKSRGEWINTVFTVRRPDFCRALKDPNGLWPSTAKNFKNLKCPFMEGVKLKTNMTARPKIDLVSPHLAGEYKIQFTVEFKNLKEVLCGNILVDVYRA